MCEKKLMLGIDIGTSSIKISVVDNNLKEYYFNSIKYEYETINNEWTEINPNVWKELLINELDKIFQCSFADKISGICPTAQMHTLIFLDENDLPVRNAIMWNDRRTKQSIESLKKALLNDLNLIHNSNLISTGSPLANLLWIKEVEKENFRRIKKVCMCKDYINYIFTGNIVTDYCDASTSCFMDLDKKEWSEEIANYFGYDIDILPKIQKSTDIVGILKDEFLKKYSLGKSIPVYTGTGDNAATVLAVKSFGESSLVLSLGTSGVVLTESDDLSFYGKNILFNYGNENSIISQLSLSTGGKSVDWWFNNILDTSEYDKEQTFTAEKIKKNEVIFLPFLSGEKYLFKNPNLSGTFFNLQLGIDRFDLNLAVLEGITFALKALYNISSDKTKDVENLYVIGGGAKSESWLKIIADIFQANVYRFNKKIEAVTGACIIGFIGLQEEICVSNKSKVLFHPDKHFRDHYFSKFEEFNFVLEKMNNIAKEVFEMKQ